MKIGRSGLMVQAIKEPNPLLQLLEKLLDNLPEDCSAKLQISPKEQTMKTMKSAEDEYHDLCRRIARTAKK